MKKNIYVISSIFVILLIGQSLGQHYYNARDALLIHKKNLWQNAQNLEINTTQNTLQNKIDAVYYKLELEIRFDPELLIGKVTGRYKSKVDNLNILVLDFDDELAIDTVMGPVSSYNHSEQKLTVYLSQTFTIDEIVEVIVEYSGIPDPGERRWFVFDDLSDGSDHVWTLSEPYGARYWWPCKDKPIDKADSVDVIVTVPSDQMVASNGSLISDTINGDKRTFHWRESYPIAPYLVSLAIAPYIQFSEIYTSPDNQSMLLHYYVYPDNEVLARQIFPDTKNHLDVLSSIFGPYPFLDEKYGLAQFGWTRGAMEHQTISSIGRVSESWEYVYIHELGHQWFGDALTCASWSDIWLNEGFASYSEALYAEQEGYNGLPSGFESYKKYMDMQRYAGDGTIYLQDTTSLSSLFGNIVYNKGSWVLHMLRHVLGDTDFFDALYQYANGPLKYSSVRTEDFKGVCEQVSGKNLNTFFDQWIYEPFFPQYTYSWRKVDSQIGESIQVDVNILQKQSGVIYEMPIDLKFIFSSGSDTTITVNNYKQNQDYTFQLNEKPVELVLDPDNWILKEAYDQSGGTFTSQIIIENIYPNPAKSSVNIEVIFWGQNDLSLKIFDINGRQINQLHPYLNSKTHRYYFKWNNDDQFGNPIAAGVYFIQPANKDYKTKDIKKVIILK